MGAFQLGKITEKGYRKMEELLCPSQVKGRLLEIDYRTKGPAYFGRIIRRAHVLSQDELTALVGEAVDKGILSDEQADEIYQADVVVRERSREDSTEVYLIVEVS